MSTVKLYLKFCRVNGKAQVGTVTEKSGLCHEMFVRHDFGMLSSGKSEVFLHSWWNLTYNTQLWHVNPNSRNSVLFLSQIMGSFDWLLAIAPCTISFNSFSLQNTNQTQPLAPELCILVQVFTVHNLLLILISNDQSSQILAPRFSHPKRAALFDPSESWLEKKTVVVVGSSKKSVLFSALEKITLFITSCSFL